MHFHSIHDCNQRWQYAIRQIGLSGAMIQLNKLSPMVIPDRYIVKAILSPLLK